MPEDMLDDMPESTRGHLDNAEEALARAQGHISDSALMRARVLNLRVSGFMPAVKKIEEK